MSGLFTAGIYFYIIFFFTLKCITFVLRLSLLTILLGFDLHGKVNININRKICHHGLLYINRFICAQQTIFIIHFI